MSHFHDSSKIIRKELVSGVTLRPIWGDKIMMSHVEISPGSEVPIHSHPHEQVGTMLEGVLEMTIGEETRQLRPGDSYVIPGGRRTQRTGDKWLGPSTGYFFSPTRRIQVRVNNYHTMCLSMLQKLTQHNQITTLVEKGPDQTRGPLTLVK